MKNITYTVLLLLFTTTLFAQKWEVDPMHSTVQFRANHMGLADIIGVFENYEVNFEPANDEMNDLALSVDVQTNSVSTRVEARDAHLKSKDFLNVEEFPNMIFRSTSFKKKGKGRYELKGELTLMGVTKKIAMEVKKGKVVTGLQNEQRIGFVAMGTVNRTDFGIAFNMDMDNGFKLISDKIDILISMEFVKQTKEEE